MTGDDKIELPREGLLKQELITWEVSDNGMLYKRTVTRKFNGLDYQDSYVSEPIIGVKS